MNTIGQGQYARQSTEENKEYLKGQLDLLQKAGVNAIVFQVRPSADAFYPSELEPWSHYLSGKAGEAPDPEWDPLQFMVDEAHARGMELHAWLNPYRVTTSVNEKLPANHVYHKHPEWFVSYDKKLYFDPALPECREFIEQVVRDIVTRYDVDAIHMDDYFYPYPVDSMDFPDDASYAKYGEGTDRGDWRRKNVDQLIEGIHRTLMETKPWVRLGIRPFGIWRNKSTDPRGSETSGLQNYDALYADVLLWTQNGWVDYLVPQLYWELEHKRASYLALVDWWGKNSNGRDLYIGQDVNRTMTLPDIPPSKAPNQLAHKVELTRENENIKGNCWWPGYSITKNFEGGADTLAAGFQSTIALVPAYTWISDEAPEAVTGLECKDGKLTWDAPEAPGQAPAVTKYVVYRLDSPDVSAIGDAENIVAVVYDNAFEIPAGEAGAYYVVTALDRVNNESAASRPILVE